MSIWFSDNYKLSENNRLNENTIISHLDIEFVELGANYLKAQMPVSHKTVQPFRKLHGGASVVLAETLGSYAAYLVINPNEFSCFGQSITANHLKTANEGEMVTGIAKAIHLGKHSHVWHIEIKNEKRELVCNCNLTVAIVPIK